MTSMGKGRVGAPARRDRLVQEQRHDPYRAKEKIADLTTCPDCDACFRDGRWTWQSGPADAPSARCPACRRIQDDYPGGYLGLGGPFLAEHEEEILALVRHVEERQRADHPLQRLMAITKREDGYQVTTTDGHLAHGIGTALRKAYSGELESAWSEGEALLRATWRR
jgi:hypothetical protein